MWCFRSLAAVLATMACAAAPLHFRTSDLPWAAVGAGYDAAIEVQTDGRCPRGDVGLAVVEGLLPRGVELAGNALTGVPRDTGTFRFRVRAVNTCGMAEQDLALVVTGRPILRVAPAELAIEYHIGGPLPPPLAILVSSTWPELPYTVTGDAAWLHTRQSQGFTPSPGSAFAADTVSVEADPKDLAPGIYDTTLTFSAHQGATAPGIRVRLTVLPPPGSVRPTGW